MGILFLFLILIILFKFIYIKINIKVLEISNIEKNNNVRIIFGLYLFKKIPIIKANLDNNSFKKESKIRSKLTKYFKSKKIKESFNFRDLKKIQIELEKLNLKIDIGAGDVLFTTYTVPIISTAIAVALNLENIKVNNNELYYRVNPMFNKESFSYNLHLNCIISLNLVNIIIATLFLKNHDNHDKFISGKKVAKRRRCIFLSS